MKILIVDDNIDFSSTMADIINSFGFDTEAINSPYEAISYMEENYSKIGLILLDIEFGFGEKLNGLDILDVFRKNYIHIPIVMITGKGTIETAVKATKLGAINFIEKNIITKEKIRGILDSTINISKSIGEDAEIHNFLVSQGLIGRSKCFIELGNNIIRYGRTELNVIIFGETGTGKKLVAKALHNISNRSRSNFITLDIPNISKERFQYELFGYVKGAFENATETVKGRFHEANKGTLFLDEIGFLPLELQSYLLLPIEERVVRKIGATESEQVNIRCIAATNKNLHSMMKREEFNEQLYHRLRECEIYVPALKERREDIIDIIQHYTILHNEDFYENKFFSQSAMSYLMEQNWPGNVRELVALIKVLLQTIPKEQIDEVDVIKQLSMRRSNIHYNDTTATISDTSTLKEEIAKIDKIKIEKTLEQNNGNVSKSAVLLGISRETLHNKIKTYQINVNAFRKSRS